MKLLNKQMRIAIIGAGIGGISLAISLKMLGFQNISLYQKDISLTARRQGYGLTILQGKKALKQLGVFEQAKKLNSPSKAHYIFDSKGDILGFYGTLFWDKLNHHQTSQKSKQKGLSMHIPRQQLRTLLFNRLMQVSSYKECVNWDMKLQKINTNQKIVELIFAKGEKIESQLVIGCDGIFSSLRQLSTLQDEKLNYLDVVIALGLCSSAHSLTKERVFQSGDGKVRIFCMPFLKNSLIHNTMWQLSMPLEYQKAVRLSKDPAEAKQFFYKLCREWHQPIPNLIKSTQTHDLMTIPTYDRNFTDMKVIDKRILLLGDSMHPMSPFKGQGANQALLDAVCLGRLISSCQNIEILNQNYKEQVKIRVESKVLQSRQRVKKYHNTSYTQIQNYLYPRIDERLINILRENSINSQCGDKIQTKILKLMQQHNYLK